MRGAVAVCRVAAAALALGAAQVSLAQAEADTITVSGSAAYRQRIAMPARAVLTVRIVDVSRADAAARLIAQVREVFGARQVPIPFTLGVPRSAFDPRASYALRATITVDDELRFTTTRHYAVLVAGAPNRFELLLEPVAAAPAVPAASAAVGAAGLALPATFAGVLPCADCAGIAHTLTLRADGLYRLRRTYLGKPGEPSAEVGRWTADASGRRIALGGGAGQRFAVEGGQTLRQLDHLGQPIQSAANLALRRTAQVDAISESLRWRGQFIYLADAASFTDCASGLRWPVAAAGDYLAAERRYVQVRTAVGAPLLVTFDGHLDLRPAMEGSPREHIVIDRFAGVEPGAGCDAPAAALLEDTDWTLVELDGKAIVTAPPPPREVRMRLSSDGSRVAGSSGCNQFMGGYERDGAALRFKQLAGTMMACVTPLMELEVHVLKMLGATSGYRIEGQRLILLSDGQVQARFNASRPPPPTTPR